MLEKYHLIISDVLEPVYAESPIPGTRLKNRVRFRVPGTESIFLKVGIQTCEISSDKLFTQNTLFTLTNQKLCGGTTILQNPQCRVRGLSCRGLNFF